MPLRGGRLFPPSSHNESGVDPVREGSLSPVRPRARVTELNILENALEIPRLRPPPHAVQSTSSSPKPAGTSSHSRSMSHPFPQLFSGKKKRHEESSPAIGFESTDDDTTHPTTPRSVPPHAAGRQKVADKDLMTGKCMTCDAMVRWPKALNVFRCTVCLTINDLKPVLLEVRQGDGHRTPVSARTGAHPGSRFAGSAPPLSNEKTRQLVDQCITTYLVNRLKHDDGLVSSPIASSPQSPVWNVKSHDTSYDSHISEGGTSEHVPMTIPIRKSSRMVGHSDGGAEPFRKPPFETNRVNLAPYSTSTPGSFCGAHMEQRNKDLRRDGVSNDSQNPRMLDADIDISIAETKADPVRRILKPLEDYIVASFGSFECINTSFSTNRPRMAPRAASEGGERLSPALVIERQPRADAQLSEMDAKTLLLGDFAENGSWWTGDRPDIKSPERSRTHRGIGDPDISDMVTVKSPKVDWVALNEWYNLVIYAGKLWRRKLESLVESDVYGPRMRRPSESELGEIDHQISEAQFHVQRVLLKTIESLLKRPGRPLTEPCYLRFLLIIFTNPLLYPSTESSRMRNRDISTSRSRSRSRDTRTLGTRGHSESQKQSLAPHPSSPRKSNIGKGTSGQHSGIIKRILGLLSNVSNECHHHLVSWFSRYSDSQFQRLVDLIGSFVTYRLTRQHGRKQETQIDPMSGLIPQLSGPGQNTSAALHAALGVREQSNREKKASSKAKPVIYTDDWQIKAAARVMALLFSANNSGLARRGEARAQAGLEVGVSAGLIARDKAHVHGQIIPISDFYNTLLDYSDLVADFEAWESKRGKFAFCQYPFFLSIWAKIQIMEHDARRQMEIKAREAFFESIMSRKALSQYLTLRVRRDCLVEDSLNRVSEVVGSGSEDIKKGLKIEFKGEEGIDAGGLRKEWFLLLVRDVFNPEHGMFIYDDDSQFCYFNPNSFETTDQFFLVGVVLGLAIYNSTILDVALPPFAFRKLLAAAPPPAPGATSHAKPSMSYSLEDLAEYRPALANGLRQLLDFEGDVETTFCRDFVADVERYGQMTQVPLCPDGEKRPVTNSSRREFVDLYVRYLLDTAVTRQFEPFKRGFYTVCGGNALSLFRPEEIELLIRGSEEPLDIASLRAVCVCENWGVPNAVETEPLVQWFWESFQAATAKDQRKLLTFITGSDRIPAMGATNLVIKVSCLGDDGSRFPVARTCFNTISLWRYSSKRQLERMLWRAVHESEGFGLK